MKYPKVVQKFVDVLDKYTENKNLDTCHIIHMYPSGIAYPNGYHDSQFFTAVIFNTETFEKRAVERRDRVELEAAVKSVSIFADGSTVVCLREKSGVYFGQCVVVSDIKKGSS